VNSVEIKLKLTGYKVFDR